MPKEIYQITYADAKALMDAATRSAKKHKVPGAIAIVDRNGSLILLESLDGTMCGASKIAMGKAATATAFKRPTIDLERVILEGRSPMLSLEGATSEAYVPLKGAYPIIYKEELIGAIAVAGTMDAEMDEVIALEALDNKGW
ncbi:GlcG/HbpS family heme-binding protein [Spongiimicrobium salis]|uniref:GlcG/HbpS family heme-binding protein n=1 Tax=Spongiimicrobium salis TaxID=1667022 RepID=UPI00374D3110